MVVRVTVRSKASNSEEWIDDFDMEFGDGFEVCVVTTKN